MTNKTKFYVLFKKNVLFVFSNKTKNTIFETFNLKHIKYKLIRLL